MSDRKEFNDFCDKNGITNLTASLQLFEQCYDKLRMSFVKDTDNFPSDGVVETINEDDLFTTDIEKCRENAETKLWVKFLNRIKWESFTHDELQKITDVVADVIVNKENK